MGRSLALEGSEVRCSLIDRGLKWGACLCWYHNILALLWVLCTTTVNKAEVVPELMVVMSVVRGRADKSTGNY